jgi:hypothetical protein
VAVRRAKPRPDASKPLHPVLLLLLLVLAVLVLLALLLLIGE